MKINWYSGLKKSTIGLLLFYIGLVFSQATSPDAGSSECECGKPVNVWYKVSTDDLTSGQVVQLDMSKGQSFSDQMYIYIIVKDLVNGDDIVIVFPNGGDWHQKGIDPFLDELEKEFETLEEYLKSKQSKEIEKNY